MCPVVEQTPGGGPNPIYNVLCVIFCPDRRKTFHCFPSLHWFHFTLRLVSYVSVGYMAQPPVPPVTILLITSHWQIGSIRNADHGQFFISRLLPVPVPDLLLNKQCNVPLSSLLSLRNILRYSCVTKTGGSDHVRSGLKFATSYYL